ncbi:MAG: acyltransferase [Rikenellaceae bacterium]
MNKLNNQRDNSIDILRFIGLTCIMLAHINPPRDVIFQLRTFDVSLMVFISGLAYAGRSISNYWDFLKRRLFRLVVPVYIFLAGYFIFNYLFAQVGVVEQIPTEKIWGSFFLQLMPSIEYVWIIRIFLTIMLITPLLVKIEECIKSDWLFITLIVALFAGQYYLVEWLKPLDAGRFVDDYILYLAYSIPFLIGLRIKNAAKWFQWLIVSLLAAAFIGMAIKITGDGGRWLSMHSHKYPPGLYFLLWGSLVSAFLWTTKEYWLRLFEWKWVYFIAQNTIWIYLWHIPFIKPVKFYLADAGWATRLIVVYSIGIAIFFLQNKLIDYIDQKGGDKSGFLKKYFRG